MTTNLKAIILNHLEQVVRERDPYISTVGHFFIREYIRQEMAVFGEVEQHDFTEKGKNHQNLILDLSPNQNIKHKPPILIAAHYDGVINSPGADDNGTGIAVLLALADFFSKNQANYPIRLVAFDLEEYGLLGSKSYASFLKESNQALRLVLSLEMLGYCDGNPNSQNYPPGLKYFYPSTGNFIALVGNIFTIPEMLKMSKTIRNNIPCEWLPAGLKGVLVPETRRSDHAPFWDLGYKAIMVTDTANLRNPNYHRASDTLETLDLDFLTNVCRGLMEAVQKIK
ncbi:MAG: M28 family peptidase [Rivularia sp. (in: cyanobacteria)]